MVKRFVCCCFAGGALNYIVVVSLQMFFMAGTAMGIEIIDVGVDSADLVFYGAAEDDLMGEFFAQTGVGDFDGDGLEDLILSTDQLHNGNGSVYIFRGGRELNSPIDLASVNADVTITGPWEGAAFGEGWSVADWDGDGYDDLFVLATVTEIPQDDQPVGGIYIFKGGREFFSQRSLAAASADKLRDPLPVGLLQPLGSGQKPFPASLQFMKLNTPVIG